MAIKGKIVVITGASSGIGEATAKLLATQGAKLVLGARRESNLKHLVETIKNAGGEAVYQVTDVTSRTDNEKLMNKAIETFGNIDVVFLNAGIMKNSRLSSLKIDEWEEMIDVNLKGVMYGIAAVLPLFTKNKKGHIITTSSVAGLKSFSNGGIYGATKWGIKDLMEVLRIESTQEQTNIRTSTLYPSATTSELLGHISEENIQESMAEHYKKFAITADKIANVVSFAIDQPEDVNINEFTIYPTKEA